MKRRNKRKWEQTEPEGSTSTYIGTGQRGQLLHIATSLEAAGFLAAALDFVALAGLAFDVLAGLAWAAGLAFALDGGFVVAFRVEAGFFASPTTAYIKAKTLAQRFVIKTVAAHLLCSSFPRRHRRS